METKRRKGFTIVELLTVMAIIAILMGLLVPAMNQVRKLAKDTSQRAQFRTIDTALEQYNGENGMYPESSQSPLNVTMATVGAQRLAEAMVGRDLFGFDPKSSWDVYNDSQSGNADYQDIYANRELPQQSPADKVAASLKRRQNPYLDSQKVEAFQLGQLFNLSTGTPRIYPGNFDNAGTRSTTYVSAPVLTDVYRSKKVTLTNGTTVVAGTPILYYKANTSVTEFPDTMRVTNSNSDDLAFNAQFNTTLGNEKFIYDANNNDELIKLYQMMKPTNANRHHFDQQWNESVTVSGTAQTVSGIWLFYNTITNPKMPTPLPYNKDTYILMSAGFDGIYGTKDDIYNFQP